MFGAVYCTYVWHTVSSVELSAAAIAVLILKTSIELIASTYGVAFLIGAIAYVRMHDPSPTQPSPRRPPVGIVYLCCDDADGTALDSLASLSYEGALCLIIHDDSRTEQSRRAVDRIAGELMSRRAWDVRVLRRPEKTGGKAGAVNYVLSETAHLYEYFLLCDNDSQVLSTDTIQRGLAHFESKSIGAVQFRSVPVSDPGYCGTNRRLAASIGAFHAFLAPAARYGWMPFIGHNALLRTRAILEVGGLTPGFFSDDLDLTVRLNLRDYRVAYASGITMGEKHPPSYTAFRKRSYKWAYGCVQTLRAHWWNVLRSCRFSFAEKLSFFQFAGFYCLQCVLLAYLCFVLLAVPLGALGVFMPDLVSSLLVGTVLVGLVYAPLLSFYVKDSATRTRGWITTLVLCGLVYGGTDFSVLRGVTDAFAKRRRAWVPTNGVVALAVDAGLFAEAAFGLALLIVPLVYLPELLYLPCWFLFAGKFLFGPALSTLYRDVPHDAVETVHAGHDDASGVDLLDASNIGSRP
jgi:GT2 family glycosyltransferase